MKFMLMGRDPLWRELWGIFEASEKREEDWKPGGRVDQLRERLERKYGIQGICSPKHAGKVPEPVTPREKAQREVFGVPFLQVDQAAKPLIWQYHPRAAEEPQVGGEGSSSLKGRGSAEPRKKTPLLLVEVDLNRVGLWDLDYLAMEFRRIVRAVLKETPREARKEQRGLASLRHVQPEAFWRDLRRYDLHMTHGLSFRLIALGESLVREGKAVPNRQRRVGWPVREEASVGDSVQRTYQAIHRKPYSAKRRRLDSPAEGVSPYSCPSHPDGSCDEACEHLKEWMRRIDPTLPSEKTAMVWAPHSYDDDEIDNLASSRPDTRRKKPLPPA